MGKRGRPRTPLQILVNRGSEQKVQQRQNTLRVEAGIPACPDWLDTEAKMKWFDLTAKLSPLGVLTEIDGGALSRYCTVWSLWLRMQKTVQDKLELTAVDIKPVLSLASELRQLENVFGLNPSARSNIVIGKTTDDKNEKFFKKSG